MIPAPSAFKRRYALLRLPIATQRLRALIAWTAHLIALAVFGALAFN